MALPSHKEIMDKMKGGGNNDEILKIISLFFVQFASAMKGEKGDSPTDEQLLKLIEPIVIKVVKEKKISNVTKEEIAAMVLSLMGDNHKEMMEDTLSEKDVLSIVKENTPSKTEIKEIAKSVIPADKSEKIIESLKKEINKLEEKFNKAEEKRRKTVSGGKPGGMGNPQHESFAISSATTTITTSYPIGAEGTAIMNFHYQNSQLFLGTHFTVGSNKTTITFDSSVTAQFEDGMVAKITYIRG